ncbi:hypothetical protein C0J45_9904 [Silurus meridionalis]|nr:hypothetical protein C0J45_9904 [Silurus meridionalis]
MQEVELLAAAEGGEGEEEDVYRDSRERRSGGEVEEKQCRRVEVWVRVGTLNVGTMTGKGRDVADMMERRKVDMLCVQETKWNGSKARNIGGGFKLFYHGVDGKRNGVGVILKEEYRCAVVNTYFKKKEDHRVTYKSGGRCTQVDYVLCRRCNLKEIEDCKVLTGDSVARQHQMVVCRMVLEAKKRRRRVKTERRIRWWKLKEEECSVRFREEVRQRLSGVKEVLDDWATTAGVMREAARKVLGVTSGNRKEDKETWWWNEEVQESRRRKRLEKQN